MDEQKKRIVNRVLGWAMLAGTLYFFGVALMLLSAARAQGAGAEGLRGPLHLVTFGILSLVVGIKSLRDAKRPDKE